ncbi:hypothetical protein ACFL43_02575 [Thermodesulfobacteriota bacterium]
MTKEKLITMLQGLLKTEENLDFLLGLKGKELEKLVAIVRERVQAK